MNPALGSKVQNSLRPDTTWPLLLQVGAKEVFQIMLQIELTTLADMDQLPVRGNVTAMVGLAGTLRGVLSIRCDERTAENIARRMLGPVGKVNPSDVPDAIAEICNMVAGNFKSKITSLSEHCLLSVPTVIRGDDYELVTVPSGDQMVVGMACESSPIWFCLAVHS